MQLLISTKTKRIAILESSDYLKKLIEVLETPASNLLIKRAIAQSITRVETFDLMMRCFIILQALTQEYQRCYIDMDPTPSFHGLVS